MGLISGPCCLRLELGRSVQRFKLYGELLLIFDSLSPWIQVWGELLMNSSFVAVNSADTGPAGTARQTAPGYREPFVARTCAAHVITERYVNYHSPVLQEGTGLDHFSLSPLPFVFWVPTARASKPALLLRENINSQRLWLGVNIAGLKCEGN